MLPQSPSPQNLEQNSMCSVSNNDSKTDHKRSLKWCGDLLYSRSQAMSGLPPLEETQEKTGVWAVHCGNRALTLFWLRHTQDSKRAFPITLAWPSVTQYQERWQNTSGWQGGPQGHSGRPPQETLPSPYGKRVPTGLVWEALVPTRRSQTTHLTAKQDGKNSTA